MSCSAPERELVTFWLAGTLDPSEAALASRHVESCADCQASVVDGRAVVEGLRELHLRADEVVAAAAGEFESAHLLVCPACRDEVALLRAINTDLARIPSPSRAAGRWAIPAAAAAVVVLGVGLAWYGSRDRGTGGPPPPRPESTIARTLAPIEPLPVRVAENRAITLRRPGDTSQQFLEAFNQAIAPYRAGRYPDAAAQLAALGLQFPDAAEAPLYEGVARLMSGDWNAAIAALDRATALANGSDWQPDAEYYAARARLAAGRDEGRAALERVCAVAGPYQAQSCRAAAGAPRSPR